jgi:hypothetical protein
MIPIDRTIFAVEHGKTTGVTSCHCPSTLIRLRANTTVHSHAANRRAMFGVLQKTCGVDATWGEISRVTRIMQMMIP